MAETKRNLKPRETKKPAPENRRETDGRFQKGQSGNPGGRPKGLANLVREETKDGQKLVGIMLQIADGKLTIEDSHIGKDGQEYTVRRAPSHRDRISAIEWLADRGFGRSISTLEISGRDGGPIQVAQASVDDLRRDLIALGAMDATGRLIQRN